MRYKEWFYKLSKEERKMIVAVAVVTSILCVILWMIDVLPVSTTIARNSYGEGDKKEEFRVTTGTGLKQEPVTVVVEERTYSEKELETVFKTCMEELDAYILGENKSLDEVRSDLNLITSMPDKPIDIVWDLDHYDVMNVRGEIQSDELSEYGTLIQLNGTLSYGTAKAEYIRNAKIYPPKLTGIEKKVEEIQKVVSKKSKETKYKPYLQLPTSFEGEKILWNKGTTHRWVTIGLLGCVMIVLIFLRHKQEEAKQKKAREREMMRDYPEIINQFVLFIGSGMTVKNAWKKIVTDYQKQSPRYAYEEMLYTLREMQSGVTEAESYERFGSRCGLPPYMKFGALLSQNLRKGTKGLTELLKMEAIQAFEERKAYAKRMGEEASTKLLMPMFLMLSVVLVIVVVPAFLSMQM